METRLNGRGLHDQPFHRLVAIPGYRWADLRDVLQLVLKSTLVEDPKVVVLEDSVLPSLFISDAEADARRECGELKETICVEALLILGQTIEHLRGALRVPQVEDLVVAGMLLDHADIGGTIVSAHLSPVIHPELLVFSRQSLVLLGVLCSTVVTHPDVEAGIIELQR